MVNITIPNLGSILTLKKDWTFRLYIEHRNTSLYQSALKAPAAGHHFAARSQPYYEIVDGKEVRLYDNKAGWFRSLSLGEQSFIAEPKVRFDNLDTSHYGGNAYMEFTIPKGSVLKVDRIYIRHGGQSYDSISFYLISVPKNHPLSQKKGKARFWAKLADVNCIEGVWDETTITRRRNFEEIENNG